MSKLKLIKFRYVIFVSKFGGFRVHRVVRPLREAWSMTGQRTTERSAEHWFLWSSSPLPTAAEIKAQNVKQEAPIVFVPSGLFHGEKNRSSANWKLCKHQRFPSMKIDKTKSRSALLLHLHLMNTIYFAIVAQFVRNLIYFSWRGVRGVAPALPLEQSHRSAAALVTNAPITFKDTRVILLFLDK